MEENVDVQSARDSARTATALVSVVVPCRNESRNIEETLKSILAQEPPQGGFEIVVVDGMSDDGTRSILERFVRENPCIQVLDNPERTTPTALNIGIRASRGAFIVIMGAHAYYAPDYIVSCVRLMDEHPESDCVGGPITSSGASAFGRAVAVAMAHKLGVGNARHRFPEYEGYAEGACFPMFRRRVFETVGLYDETLLRNQDDEFNFRLTKGGGRIFISPRASSTYRVRETPGALFRQYLHYGYWKVAVLRKHQRPSSFRQLAPAAGLLSAVILAVLGMSYGGIWWTIAILLMSSYLLVLAGGAVLVGIQYGVRTAILFPVAATIMHLSYALGFMAGLVRGLATREKQPRISMPGVR